LTRFYGLYKMIKGNSKEVNFIVMANVLNVDFPIHEQYDLKGSTVNRSVKVEGEDLGAIARKDNDFQRKLCLGPLRKAWFRKQIECDASWLESHDICD